MKVYRCAICGEVYLGTQPPSRCPFCGVDQEHLVDTREYDVTTNDIEVTDQERADIEKAIALEVHDSRWYITMSKRDKDSALGSAFKRLSKVEQEHCELFCKLIKVEDPSNLTDEIDGVEEWCADIAAAIEAEGGAAKYYREVSERATNERVREVFAAIADVELDHVETNRFLAGIAGCE